jgi:hypothetical protein
MDVGTATAANLYSYQSSLKNSGQSAAVLQILAKAASDAGSQGSADDLSAVAGQASSLGSYMSGLNAALNAQGGALPTSSLAGGLVGGVQASSATSLLGGLASGSGNAGLQGFAVADLNPGLAQALSAYQYNQSALAAAAAPTPAQAAAAASAGNAMNLLG